LHQNQEIDISEEYTEKIKLKWWLLSKKTKIYSQKKILKVLKLFKDDKNRPD
jgi:hypothetical protein